MLGPDAQKNQYESATPNLKYSFCANIKFSNYECPYGNSTTPISNLLHHGSFCLPIIRRQHPMPKDQSIPYEGFSQSDFFLKIYKLWRWGFPFDVIRSSTQTPLLLFTVHLVNKYFDKTWRDYSCTSFTLLSWSSWAGARCSNLEQVCRIGQKLYPDPTFQVIPDPFFGTGSLSTFLRTKKYVKKFQIILKCLHWTAVHCTTTTNVFIIFNRAILSFSTSINNAIR